MFLTWLNFGLGIETCLFDGLDSYVETWLQFCFPLYILITAIIISSHYSMKISKLCGKNIVPVLATLLLLSYSKLLQLVVDVFTFARILHSDGYTNPVWLYDGNVDYLKGKHACSIISCYDFVTSPPYSVSNVFGEYSVAGQDIPLPCHVLGAKIKALF